MKLVENYFREWKSWTKFTIRYYCAAILSTFVDQAADGDGKISAAGQDQLAKAVVPGETLAFNINGVDLRTAALGTAAANSDATTGCSLISNKNESGYDTYNTNCWIDKRHGRFY